MFCFHLPSWECTLSIGMNWPLICCISIMIKIALSVLMTTNQETHKQTKANKETKIYNSACKNNQANKTNS